MQKQVTLLTEKLLSQYLCGYRKGFSRKKNLDQKWYIGAVLMDLSKAFDTVNRGFLLAKLHAYSFDRVSHKK